MKKFKYNPNILDKQWHGLNRVSDDWFQNQFEAIEKLDLDKSIDKEGILAYFYEQSDTDLRNAITSLATGLYSLMSMVIFDKDDPYQEILWNRAVDEFFDLRLICRDYDENFLEKIDSEIERIQKDNLKSLKELKRFKKHKFPILKYKTKDFISMEIEDILNELKG